ncbi:MAG: Lar family restriction alleviation protein [Candidatus Omnitrophica bacterium]|nr:Lar family restriction alleviation protein [Candidatus Omnitrophota bacterium]
MIKQWTKRLYAGIPSELLRCPFCGFSRLLEHDEPYRSYVECGWCGARTDEYYNLEEALCAWNRRCSTPTNALSEIKEGE